MKNLGQGLLIRPAWFFGAPMNPAIQLEFLGLEQQKVVLFKIILFFWKGNWF